MADKFAITAGGNWNDDTTWSTTSGGANDTVKPTAADDVFLDANSGNVTINAASVCRSLNCTGYVGTLTHNASVTLTIGDATAGASNIALKFVAGMTYTRGSSSTSDINFISTSATQQEVDFANKTVGEVLFNAASSGSWIFTGSFTGQQLKLQKGTLNLNDQTIVVAIYDYGGFDTRTITMGAADITITGGANSLALSSSGALTVTANTATIRMTGSAGGMQFAGGGTNLNGASIIVTGLNCVSTGTFTCENFTITGQASKNGTFTPNTNFTVNNTFTCNGNSAINRVLVQSSVVGTARTITAATVVVTNTDFQDITGAGAGSWDLSAITGGSGDCGGNSGITFTTGATQTWNGTSGGNWSTNAWTTRVPLPQDDVIINVAFSASQTVTEDMPRMGRSIDWTGASGSPTFALSAISTLYGSLTLISGLTMSGSQGFNFAGRSSFTITSAGKQFGANGVTIIAPSGTYTLQDPLSTSGTFILSNGTFDAATFDVTYSQFASNNSNTRGLTMGTGTWTSTGTGAINIWSISSATGLTFSGSSSTIVVTGTTSSTRTFVGAGLTYGTLTYTIAGSTGKLTVTGSNSFAIINFSDSTNARIFELVAGTTTTIRNVGGLNIQGTTGKLMTIQSSTSSGHTISSTGQQICDYLSISYSTAQGGGSFYAGGNSTNGGNNNGWIFAAPGPIRGVGYVALSQIERAYFVQKVGGAEPREPLNNIKRRYMSGFIGAGVNARTPLQQLEKLWLAKVLANAGITTMNFNSLENLWKLAVISISQAPSNYLGDNKIKFYSNAS